MIFIKVSSSYIFSVLINHGVRVSDKKITMMVSIVEKVTLLFFPLLILKQKIESNNIPVKPDFN